MHKQRITDLVLFSSICLITWLIYLPGLDGSFVYDDYVNIVKNKQIRLESFTPADLSQLFVGLDGRTHILSSRPVAMQSWSVPITNCRLQQGHIKRRICT